MPPLSDDPCNDGGGAQMRSGLPADFRLCTKSLQPTSYGKKPPCAKCRQKKENCAGMKYIQPEIPASYKPESRYKQAEYPFESGTIYRLSYPGVEGEMMKDCKPKSTMIHDNIAPSKHPFSQDTTFRLSYTGVAGERAVSYKPVYSTIKGTGPMQFMTTNRHDYSPKYSERPVQFRLNNNIHLSTAKMENNTTTSLSYQPVEAEKVVSYKPKTVYKQSEYKLEQDTINRLSYQPWDPTPKEVYPWQKKEMYKQPNHAMENYTIYRASFLPVENIERPPSFKPPSCVANMVPDRPFANETIYRESYQDNGVLPRPVPVVRKENMYLSNQPMSQDTTFRLSYTGAGGEKAIPYKPIMRSMMSSGPMQSVTTQRHDFTPKPILPVENFKPQQTIVSSNFKMDDTTTFRASYQPNDPVPKTESYKPVSVYRKSAFPLESDTINSLSYQPWSPMPKEEYPWMKKPTYQQPNRVMDGTSIYRGSFLAPGSYVPEDCSPAYDDECDCQKQGTATDDL